MVGQRASTQSYAFGEIALTDEEKAFFDDLCGVVTRMCRRLPESTQTDAIFFAMKYSRISIGEPLHFFKNYYAPCWSVIYWIMRSPAARKMSDDEYRDVLTVHATAMLLHSLDDHLSDGQLKPTQLLLLIRGEAWRMLHESLARLTKGIEGGSGAAAGFIDDYYKGMSAPPPETLDEYCSVFARQLATGLVAPVLTAMRLYPGGIMAEAVRRAFERFGIAWRLLDDVQDLEDDMAKGDVSGAFLLLSKAGRALWRAMAETGEEESQSRLEKLRGVLAEERIIERLVERIVYELDEAARIAEGAGLDGLAAEYYTLASPLLEKGRSK